MGQKRQSGGTVSVSARARGADLLKPGRFFPWVPRRDIRAGRRNRLQPFIHSDDPEIWTSGSPGQQRISASFHFSRTEVFLPRQEHPDMAEGVAHTGGAGTVEHVRGGLNLFSPRLNCASQQYLVVIKEDMEPGGATPKDPRLGVKP